MNCRKMARGNDAMRLVARVYALATLVVMALLFAVTIVSLPKPSNAVPSGLLSRSVVTTFKGVPTTIAIASGNLEVVLMSDLRREQVPDGWSHIQGRIGNEYFLKEESRFVKFVNINESIFGLPEASVLQHETRWTVNLPSISSLVVVIFVMFLSFRCVREGYGWIFLHLKLVKRTVEHWCRARSRYRGFEVFQQNG